MRRLAISLVLIAAVILFLFPGHAAGQAVNATLLGTVTDSSGGTVAGAQVTIMEMKTGVKRNATTNESGNYQFSDIPPGQYEVAVEKQGFKRSVRAGIDVLVNAETRVNVDLAPGAVNESVVVTAETPILQTDRADINHVLQSSQIVDLPLMNSQGRNFQQLYQILPGFTPPVEVHSDSGNPQRSMATQANGMPQSNNNTRVDGATISHPWLPRIVAYVPPVEAVETVNVVTNSFDAEQGMAGGAAVNVSIKSGTNDIHGSGFEFFRNDVLNANTWESNWQGADKSKVRWNQFGGTIGGPIKKDQLFFFGDYSGERLNFPARTQTLSVFTDKERIGDFSELCTTGFTNGICNPATKPGDRSIQGGLQGGAIR